MPVEFHITAEMDDDFRRRATVREDAARPKAVAALRALEKMGCRAWVVGSLVAGTFTVESDVDYIVDCERNREHDVFLTIEEKMGDFPFDLVFCRWFEEDAMAVLMENAKNASELVKCETSS